MTVFVLCSVGPTLPRPCAMTDILCCAVLVQYKMLLDGSMQPELTPCAEAQGEQKELLRRLISKAKEDWKAADHPHWTIRDMDSTEFLDSHLQPGQVGLHTSL